MADNDTQTQGRRRFDLGGKNGDTSATERADAEKAEAERVERADAARAADERVEAERVEAEKAERVEAERVEAERVEAERVEAERVEAERVEAEKKVDVFATPAGAPRPVVLKAPPNSAPFTIGGEEFTPDNDGLVEVPAHHAAALRAHGFVDI